MLSPDPQRVFMSCRVGFKVTTRLLKLFYLASKSDRCLDYRVIIDHSSVNHASETGRDLASDGVANMKHEPFEP